jgi:hypothetical protein
MAGGSGRHEAQLRTGTGSGKPTLHRSSNFIVIIAGAAVCSEPTSGAFIDCVGIRSHRDRLFVVDSVAANQGRCSHGYARAA